MTDKRNNNGILQKIYTILRNKYGPMNWWPAESDFEVMIGAILTQNTAWINVEKAMDNLKARGLLTFKTVCEMDLDLLKQCIRPSGYYNQKALKIRNFISFVKREYNFSIDLMKKEDTYKMREKLLSISGIGEETADSILLYALKKPVFVIDTYTRRILERHNIIEGALKEKYKKLQMFIMTNIPPNDTGVELYNEYHALIVNTGKMFCKKTPQCDHCPLKEL